ncbi:serine protease inhibitor A6-like [Mantella aurantiaca]
MFAAFVVNEIMLIQSITDLIDDAVNDLFSEEQCEMEYAHFLDTISFTGYENKDSECPLFKAILLSNPFCSATLVIQAPLQDQTLLGQYKRQTHRGLCFRRGQACGRKMKILLLLPLFISLILASGHVQQNHEIPDRDSSVWDTSAVYEAYMDFAVRIYKFMSSRTARAPLNLLFSPISIYTTLAMLSLGARSATRTAILQGMGLNCTKTDKDLNEAYRKLLHVIAMQTRTAEFQLGNEIFMEKSVNFSTKYQQNVIYYYNASMHAISFSDTQIAKNTINTLVSKRTNNKIPNIVRSLGSKTMMVVLDYSILQAKWKFEFDKQNTEMRDFFLSDDRKVSVPMMRREGTYKSYRDDEMNCNVVEVPYVNNIILMIIVPELGQLYKLEQKLTIDRIKNYFSATQTSVLDLYIPKVCFDNFANVKYALLAMEMGNIFSSDNADFSKMSKKPRLKVSEVYHQSYANITEGTSEVSSATASQSNFVYSNPQFKADRPFFMVIFHRNTRTILWMGRVMDPSKS